MQPVYGRHDITFDPQPQKSLYGGMLPDAGFMPYGDMPLVDVAGYIVGHGPQPGQDFGMAFAGIPSVIQPFVHGGGLPSWPGP